MRGLVLGGTAVVAAAGFAGVAAASARRDTAALDAGVRDRLAAPRGHPARRAARVVARPGKWVAYVPGAVGIAAFVLTRSGRQRSRRAGAGAIVLASAAAAALGPVFDRYLPQPPAPPGHRSRRHPVFPSGHALGASAVALASAYVLVRESILPAAAVLPAALAYPIVSAGGKLVADRHWATDVVGGYLAGVAVAAGALALYEGVNGR